MKKPKLISYLETFSSIEWREFKKYLIGSAGKQSDVFRLYELTMKFSTHLDSKELQIERIQSRLFSNMTKKSALNVMSKLVKHIEEYWIFQTLRNDEIAYKSFRLQALNKREFYKEVEKQGQEIEKLILNNKRVNLSDDFYYLSALHHQYFSQNPVKNTPAGSKILRKCIDLVSSFGYKRLYYYRRAAINRGQVYRENWNRFVHSHFTISSNESLADKVLRLYGTMDSSINFDKAEELQKIYLDSDIDISEDLSFSFFTVLKSLLVERFHEDSGAIENLLVLIRQGTANDRMLYKGKTTYFTFLNNFDMLLKYDSPKAAISYLNDLQKTFPRHQREEMTQIARMKFFLYTERYDELISLSSKSRSYSWQYKRYEKTILLKTYYSIYRSDIDFLNTKVRNYKEFIKRSRKHFGLRSTEGHLLFLKIYVLLISNVEKSEILNIYESFVDKVFYKKWLIEKITAHD